MPLELARPDGLWLASLLAPLVLLYILRVRRSRRTVPSLLLWKSANIELSAQRPFRRFLPRVSLLIEALAVLALAGALAHPTRRMTLLAGDHVGVVVDVGTTMQTVEHGTTSRFEQARSRLRSLIAALPPGSDLFIVTAGSSPSLRGAPLADRVRLSTLADSLEPEDAAPDLDGAIAQATQRLRRLPGTRELVIIGDKAAARADRSLPGIGVSVWQVGTEHDNASIRVLDVRRTRSAVTAPERVEVLAKVNYQGTAACSKYLSLRQANTPTALDSRQLQLSPGEEAAVVLSFEPTGSDAGAALLVELSPGDSLSIDDRAFIRVPAPERLTAVLTPPGTSPWLERAIVADGNVDLYSVEGAIDPSSLPLDGIVFSVGTCPSAPTPGDLVVVNPPGGPCLGLEVGSGSGPMAITSWNEADPRMRFVSLDDVTIAEGRRLDLGPDASPLIQASAGTVAADVSTASKTVTVLGFELEASNWPLKASFVMFVRNLLEVARGHRVSPPPAGYEVGRSIRVRVPDDVQSAVWTRPNGSAEPLTARGGIVVVPSTKHAGHHFLAWQGRHAGSLVLPVNLGPDVPLRSASDRDAAARASRTNPDALLHAEGALADLSAWLAAVALLLVVMDVVWVGRHSRRPDARVAAAVARVPR